MMLSIKTSSIIVLICTVLAKCDYYSSITGLENLLEVESSMVNLLEKYLQAEEFKISYLRNFLAGVETELKNASNDTLDYYENPINSLKALTRMTKDWRDFLNIQSVNEDGYATSLESWKDLQPNMTDLIGAANGVARLQQTYGLKTEHIANGTLMGITSSLEMHASDCYYLGISLLQAGDPKNAITWLIESRVRLANELKTLDVQNSSNLHDETILKHLNNATSQIGNAKLGLLLAGEKLNKDPNDQPAKERRLKYSTKLSEKLLSRHRLYNITTKPNISNEELYEKTCSGKLRQTPAEKRNLRCRYKNNDVPFCQIAPFKVEELSLDPYVAYYHESIYESEIEQILSATKDNVERSEIGDEKFSTISEIRTSKNSWLHYNEHDFLDRLEQRLVDMTGLSMETGEALQVANYGIGGHYGTHYDFFEDDNQDMVEGGNRILTALFYINDVELGGATAFPDLRLAVQPIRRSLVMWYNLHKSLELDYRTIHAGCPVIKGSKWICNQWFHSGDQEFYRPCDLKAEGFKSIEFKKPG